MASARGEKVVHQDYIARIRYSNTLPPPPNPPRLLDIPNTGLAGGQYTAPGFASRLAREQPLNIEADAELGMPLDLVGMPGIFDGDESSIQAPLHPPPIHPHDRALLRPLSTLGKPKFSDSGVSFLRRTEYISAYSTKGSRHDSSTSKALLGNAASRLKRARPNVDRESPEYIKSQVIEKGFDIAASNLKDSSRITHPSKRNMKLVGAYPIIPDLEAIGDLGGFVEVKFGRHPALKDTYDSRLETALLQPMQWTKKQEAERLRLMEAHLIDPVHNPKPSGESDYDYQFFLLPSKEESENYKRKFDPADLMHDDDTLYPRTDDQGACYFRFDHIRTYETVSQVTTTDTRFDELVVLSIDDGKKSGRQKGAYYSPVVSRLHIDPRRKKNMAKKFHNVIADDDELKIDYLKISLADPDEQLAAQRQDYIEFPYGKPDDAEDSPHHNNEENGDIQS